MAAIVWLPLDENHPYHSNLAGLEEKPHDGLNCFRSRSAKMLVQGLFRE